MSQSAETRPLEPDPYAAMFEHSLDGVLLTVPDGRVLAANPAARQILGRSEEQICAIGRQGLADPTDPRWATALAERARTGRTRTQARMLRPDGTSFEIDLSSAVFTAADGQPRNVVIFRDLTEHLALARAVALADDRDRIAAQMYRTVVRRASTASILAHSLLTLVESDEAVRSRVWDLVREVDEIAVEVRQAIFRLALPSDPSEAADSPEPSPGGAP
ncbi:MAG TPA: PAS domain-containing protein [Solirubrobacteraceae bacterium]|nr:PAS domain-containing protein [Solirubrobacteraceae bacterium]